MSINTSGMAYPFDPTGTAATNQITNEPHVLTAVTWGGYHFVVPRFAPFFADSVILNFKSADGTYKPLVEGKDYYFSHEFISASRACAKRVYGSISFLDPTLAGVLNIVQYNTIGDIWTQDDIKIAEILADELHNPRITSWESVVDLPVSFPVIDHAWNLVDMVGMSDVVAAIQQIEQQLRATGQQGLADHIANTNNPHKVTADQVGLGSVRNLSTADQSTAIAGTSNDYYITPLTLRQAMDAGPTAALNLHVTNTNNPHGVTAAQTGAYSKTESDNLLAGKLDKSAKAADSALFSGYRPADFAAYVLQGTASNASLFAGMSPTDFKAYLQNGAAADSEKFNGLTYPEAKADILSGQAASTATFGNYDFTSFVNYLLGQTISNATHFNGYSYADAKADILSGTSANATTLAGRTTDQLASLILGGQAADSLKFNGKTYADVKADFLSSQVANATNFGGYSTDQYAAYVLTGTAANSLKLNGQTPAEFAASILAGTAANANTLGGMTAQDIINQSSTSYNTAAQSASVSSSGETLGDRWLAIGQVYLPNSTTEYSSFGDAQWLITGLDYDGSIDSECHHVRVSSRTAMGPGVRIVVTNLGGPRYTANQYGYTLASVQDNQGVTRQQATVYVRLGANNTEVTVTKLTRSSGDLLYNRMPVTTEPTGITYVSNTAGTDPLVHQSDLSAVQSTVSSLGTSLTSVQTGLQSQIDQLTASFNTLVAQFS